MISKPVKHSHILKVALLMAILVSTPRKLYLYNLFSEGRLNFDGQWLIDLLFRLILLFLYSWLILQLNSNWFYAKVKIPRVLKWTALVAINLFLLPITIGFWIMLYPLVVGMELTEENVEHSFVRYFILLVVLLFMARTLRLSKNQQESKLENERLKQQSLRSELQALKNQIDPHFLFNALNSLSSLVRDNEQARLFVKKLSFMYRYILQSSGRDLVTISEELKFLESYTYLIKARYRDRFSIVIEIDDSLLEESIPPLALQLLVENAVKHNEISDDHPLKVKIYGKEEKLFIQNRVRPRRMLEEGTGYGLSNLKKRYFLLKKQKIKVVHENDNFTIELPLQKTI